MCRNLVHLDLSQNILTGDLPHTLAYLPNLKYLDLTGNNISGEFSTSFGRFQKLESGSDPAGAWELDELGDLWLTECNLVGEIPDSLGRLERLNDLNLAINHLVGYSEFAHGVVSVVQIELYNNSLIGELRRGFSNLTNLRLLDFSMTESQQEFTTPMVRRLQQPIHRSHPTQFMRESETTRDANDIQLVFGQIPSSLEQCRSLNRIRLRLGHNKLSGEIPTGFWGLPSVYLLELVNNSFSGHIGKSIANANNLSLSIISRNQFNGTLPEEIVLVGILDLQGNEIEGSLSVFNYLNLSDNRLTGRIPFGRQNLKLNQLNLSNNLLSGELPHLFDKDMYKNRFLGNPDLCGNFSVSCGTTKKAKAIDKSKWTLMSFHKLGFSEYEILGCLDEDNVIGKGASGKVYKVVLSNSKAVAVKKLWRSVKKGYDGVDLEKSQLRVSVYEYMPNGSLVICCIAAKVVCSIGQRDTRLSWMQPRDFHICIMIVCLRLCIEMSSPITLLDGDFGARVADFGAAKVVDAARKVDKSMSVIAGSCGYIAPGRLPIDPEYGEKDIVSGSALLDQKGADYVSRLQTRSLLQRRNIQGPRHRPLCTSPLPINRPSMRRVVKMLQNRPGYFVDSGCPSSSSPLNTDPPFSKCGCLSGLVVLLDFLFALKFCHSCPHLEQIPPRLHHLS
ncbi:hypothetical protein F3Y22_tig00013285pilonHSYRG00212 [Hibiscus syriacus]|uniref:Protein kinase domain-containing protein n=1 Tax=Hibiscus syriacus TaxID=106335 RepID=A0A6A3C4U9_HIBSY|nr:hypothetical protein F3Y22_tig00013285pilonHSYRG00212 [Hibiscus syriacus]